MKLFLWVDVLRDYTEGVMFAIAETEHEARKLIWETFPGGPHEWYRHVEEDLKKNPTVIDTPFGFHLYGGG